ncbi:MAG TPA: MFS transporter [Solirubrobacteraceae bacterium]|nr:MFS transporter [Solirubrobacteraceae bacterium]
MEELTATAGAVRAGLDRRALATLASGHLLADATQGVVPALLPFLISERGLSYAAASALVLASTVSSSVIQPLFGYYSDRRPRPWLMPAGVALGGAGVALAGLTPSYPLLVLAILASGVGVAAFHPEGARLVRHVSGDRRATAMSVFSVGGTAGFALGPALVTALVLAFGLNGTVFLLVPAGAVALLLVRELPRLARARTADETAGAERGAPAPDAWGPFLTLAGIATLRSFTFYGLLTFVPLYFVASLGTSDAEGSSALTVLLGGGIAGTLIGGRLADRVGRKPILIGSMGLLPPLIFILLQVQRGPVLVLLLALVGAMVVASYTVTVVMGQEYLPNRVGVASGVTLGLAIGMGGVGASILGIVADRFSLDTVMAIVAVLPLAALALTLTLPKTGTRGFDAVPFPRTGERGSGRSLR